MAPTHSVRSLLLLPLLLFPMWTASTPVLAKDRASMYPRSYVLAYIPDGADVQPINPDTLADMPGPGAWIGGQTTYTPPQIEVSADGKTMALVVYRGPGTVTQPKDVQVQVLAADSGAQLAAFHPQRAMSIAGFTPDGQHLYGYQPVGRLGAQALYIIDAQNGHVIDYLPPARAAGLPLFDLARHRVFMLNTLPFSPTTHQPQAPVLSVYDLAAKRETASIRLDGVTAGFGQTGKQVNGIPVMDQWMPGVALSPDGSQIAILDGADDSLRLVDTGTMTVAKTETVAPPTTLLQQFGQTIGIIPVPAYAKELEGISLSMQYSPDGKSLYVTGNRASLDAGGAVTWHGLGLRRIDVPSGTVEANVGVEQLIWWWQVAPDGSAVYVLVPTQIADNQFDCPCALRRLDPQSLQSTAQRMFSSNASDTSPTFYMLAAP